MRGKWLTAATIILGALVMCMSVAPASAQTEPTDETVQPIPKALKVRAPRVAQPNQDVMMTVYERNNTPETDIQAAVTPVPGADMWALTENDFTSLRERIADALSDGDMTWADLDLDYETIIRNMNALYLGQTSEDGQVIYSFTEEGKYHLVALKDGCRPGFAPLTIKTRPSAIAIRAPRMISPGQEMTIATIDRKEHSPVAEVNVWAVSRDNAVSVLKDILPWAETIGDISEYETRIRSLGAMWLGSTDLSGELKYTFADSDEGKYFLIAVKTGYLPGFAPLTVKEQGNNSEGNQLRERFQNQEGLMNNGEQGPHKVRANEFSLERSETKGKAQKFQKGKAMMAGNMS